MENKFKRWAVRYTVYDGQHMWLSANGGHTEKFQSAYLYSKHGVALSLAKSIAKRGGCYNDVKVITFYVVEDETSCDNIY